MHITHSLQTSSQPHKSSTVNNEIRVGDSKYVLVSDILLAGHVTRCT